MSIVTTMSCHSAVYRKKQTMADYYQEKMTHFLLLLLVIPNSTCTVVISKRSACDVIRVIRLRKCIFLLNLFLLGSFGEHQTKKQVEEKGNAAKSKGKINPAFFLFFMPPDLKCYSQ